MPKILKGLKSRSKLLKNRLQKIVHINMHVIKRNHKEDEREPVITVKTYKSNDYGHEVVIDGPCRVVYRPDKPLSCGARVWIVTEAEVEVITFDVEEEKS